MTARCPECGGSGKRAGIHTDLECFDCGGEGQWEDELLCIGCDQPFDANGFCAACEQYAENLFGTECLPDPLAKRAAA